MKNIGLLICVLMTFTCSSQPISMGLGFAVNQTRLRQNAPTINVDFSNPHKAGIGISAHAITSLALGKKYSASLKPGLSILKTKSDVTSDQHFEFFNLSAEFGYAAKSKIFLNAGVEYAYLIRWLSKFKGPYRDWTFFANRRHFIHPVMSLGYQADPNWKTYLRFEYFLRDIFNSGALDNEGNIVGPVMVYPFTIGIGCTYEINKESPQKRKRN